MQAWMRCFFGLRQVPGRNQVWRVPTAINSLRKDTQGTRAFVSIEWRGTIWVPNHSSHFSDQLHNFLFLFLCAIDVLGLLAFSLGEFANKLESSRATFKSINTQFLLSDWTDFSAARLDISLSNRSDSYSWIWKTVLSLTMYVQHLRIPFGGHEPKFWAENSSNHCSKGIN